MTHFGIICLEATGHLNTVFPIGREMQRRGHIVTIFSTPGAKPKAIELGFNFRAIGEKEYLEKASSGNIHKKQLSGIAALKDTFARMAQKTEIGLRDTPQAVKEESVEVLLTDLSVFEGRTVADILNLPYVTICCLLPFYQHDTVPPIATTWQYNPVWWARVRNKIAYKLFNRLSKPVWEVISKYRKKHNLPPLANTNDLFSNKTIITRHFPEFEFPHCHLPPHFHFTGPFHEQTLRQKVDFPFDKLNGKPLIYASMGTLQNRSEYIFRCIAEACNGLDIQLVISLGGGLNPEALPNLPGTPIVVKYAPQLELLQKAALNITHAGLNTTLESLSYGVPMIAIPITDDQPGVAARIVWTGAGELINLSQLTAPKLRETINQVLTQPQYKKHAVELQQAINRTGGVSYAVDIIEQVQANSRH